MQHSKTTGHRSLPAKFFEALDQEILLSQDMLAILSEEQKALVAMDMQALIRLSGKKENRLSRIQVLDSLLANLAAEFNPEATGKPARLAALIPLLNPEEGNKLGQSEKAGRAAGRHPQPQPDQQAFCRGCKNISERRHIAHHQRDSGPTHVRPHRPQQEVFLEPTFLDQQGGLGHGRHLPCTEHRQGGAPHPPAFDPGGIEQYRQR
ncbi:MAG: flagellar export chaperone FlgN [Deltaproteobacteria bacterium]|nr:flagellar export chaperone FlgN [Deltaproteobacteria bacterium]